LALIAALTAATIGAVQASGPVANATPAGTPSVSTATDGREGGLLDFRGVKIVKPVRCSIFDLTVAMWAPWSFKLLPNFSGGIFSPLRGKNRLTLLFDRNKDGKPDNVTGVFIDDGPGAVLEIIQPSTQSSLDPIGLQRPTPASVRFRIDGDVLDALMGNYEGTTVLRIAFTSVFGTHHDRIPNSGWIHLVSHC
jgi:hypothetical protein